MKTNATIEQLQNSLNFVNKQFDGNIKFKTLEQISKNRISFTLTVKDSKNTGHRRGYYSHNGNLPKRLAAACWHVHGYFFEYLFLTYDNIVIYSQGKKMTSNLDNWKLAGNIENLCDCNK